MRRRAADVRLLRRIQQIWEQFCSISTDLCEVSLLKSAKHFLNVALGDEERAQRIQTRSAFPDWALVSSKEARHLTVKIFLEVFEERKFLKCRNGGKRLQKAKTNI